MKKVIRRTEENEKRILSALLTLCMALSMMPGVSFTAQAEESEQQQNTDDSNAIIDEFGLSRAAEQEIDLDDQVSPFGEGITNLNPITELYMHYAGGNGTAGALDVTGYLSCNNDGKSGSLTFNGNKNSGYLERYGSNSEYQGGLSYYKGPGAITGAENSSAVNNSNSKYNSGMVCSSSVAFNRGSGKNNMVAEVSLLDQYGISGMPDNQLVLTLYELSADGSPCIVMEDKLGMLSVGRYINGTYSGTTNMKDLKLWEADAFTEITAGDFDGNGRDEVAVYIPNQRMIRIYGVMDVDSGIGVYTETEIPLSIEANTKGYPSVSLTTADLRCDYSEELVIAVSDTMFNGLRKDDAGNRISSFLQVYDLSDGFGSSDWVNDEFVFLPPDPMYDQNLDWGGDAASCFMLGANVSSGDINGDGVDELVIAGYHGNWSIAGEMTIEPSFDCYLYTWMYMNGDNELVSGTNDLPYAVQRPNGDFLNRLIDNSFEYNQEWKMYFVNRSQYIPPIPLQVVNTQGDG